MPSDRIYIIGLMGSGKSTLGEALAEALQYQFCDTDRLVEQAVGMTIPEMVKQKGWEYFRKEEQKILYSTEDLHNMVIATGGGMPAFGYNIQWMKANGLVMWLEVSARELARRLAPQQHLRPLLAGFPAERLEESLQQLQDKRRVYYEQAHVTLRSDHLGVAQLVDALSGR